MDVEARSLQGLLDRLCLSVIEVPHALRLCSSLALHFRSIVAKHETEQHAMNAISFLPNNYQGAPSAPKS
jgi:hypothetical protein